MKKLTHEELSGLIFDGLKAVLGPLHSSHLDRNLSPADIIDALMVITDEPLSL